MEGFQRGRCESEDLSPELNQERDVTGEEIVYNLAF